MSNALRSKYIAPREGINDPKAKRPRRSPAVWLSSLAADAARYQNPR